MADDDDKDGMLPAADAGEGDDSDVEMEGE